MKRLAKPVAYILLVLAVLLLAAILWGSHIIRFSINTAAPRILGVPASVERVVFRPFRGHMTIAGLQIANPEGYSSNLLMQVDAIRVDLKTKSLFSDTIQIQLVEVAAPTIHYELIGTRSNLGALIAGMQPAEAEAQTDTPSPPEEDTTTKTTCIDELRITVPRIQFQTSRMLKNAIILQPGDIVLENLGGPDQSTGHIIVRVLQAIMHTSLHAAGPAGHFIDNTLQGTSGAINQIGRTASETVSKGTEAVSKGIGDAFGSLFGGGRRVAQPPPAAAAE